MATTRKTTRKSVPTTGTVPPTAREFDFNDPIMMGIFQAQVTALLSKYGFFEGLYSNGMISQSNIDRLRGAFIEHFMEIFGDDKYPDVVAACEAAETLMSDWEGIPDPVSIHDVGVTIHFKLGAADIEFSASGIANTDKLDECYSFLFARVADSYDKWAKTNKINLKDSQGEIKPMQNGQTTLGNSNTASASMNQNSPYSEIQCQMVAIQKEWKNNKTYLSAVMRPTPGIKYPVAIYPDKVQCSQPIDWNALPMGDTPINANCIVLMKEGKAKGVKSITL